MKLQTLFAIGVIQCGCLLVPAQASGKPASSQAATPSTQQSKQAASPASPEGQGERKFQENCGRCHKRPEELPTRITGTVLLHMRFRASLSAADQREILRYLAP